MFRLSSLTPDLGRPRNNASIPEDLELFFIKTGVIAWGEELRELLETFFEFLNFLCHCRVRDGIWGKWRGAPLDLLRASS